VRGDRYRPVLDFDRKPKRVPLSEALKNIPTELWDKPMQTELRGLTPRYAARHYIENGCLGCKYDLERLAETL
jgi:hypothetical protein